MFHLIERGTARMTAALLICVFLSGCLEPETSPESAPSESHDSGSPDAQLPPSPQPAPEPVPPPPSGVSPDRPIAAAPAEGFTTLRVRTSYLTPGASDGVGAFRNPCRYSHMAFDDPIVFPGQPGASHLHMFFGNTSANAYTTTASLDAANSSTCSGGIANESAYWVPAMIDTATNMALVPTDNLVYYKRGYNANPASSIQPPPDGLRFLAGNRATQSTPFEFQWQAHHSFECNDNGNYVNHGQSIPACPVGGKVMFSLVYPNCWDGVNLDSPDHRSHMAYSGGGACPASHPVAIPEIALNIGYPVQPGQDTSKWRLSSDTYVGPGGYSAHGDLWIKWDHDIRDAWLNRCVRASLDCHAFLLGDGRELY